MITLNEFQNRIIEQFSKTITDKVFLMIQNDRELLSDYLHLLEHNKLNILNSSIAKEVKKRYKLQNRDLKNKNPQSYLIQSFEEFEID